MGEPARSYPADPAEAGLRLFMRWFGHNYARSTAISERATPEPGILSATVGVGRRWTLDVTVANTLAADANLQWEAARAAVERRLDVEGHSLALWVPRGAELPAGEPGLSQLILATNEAKAIDDGRLEIRRPVSLYLRRNATTGSVVTVLGGLSAHWALFTNRVPGSYYLNSQELFRMATSQEERDALVERIVTAANQPTADESQTIAADDTWTANNLEDGGSCVLGSPRPENDEQSAALRRNLRVLLKAAAALPRGQAEARALVLLGAATYGEEEKLSWAIRGMDPTLYSGYDFIAVVTDGVVRTFLQPPPRSLPWDA